MSIGISILGSTGSIGRSAISLLRNELSESFSIDSISFNQNYTEALSQIQEFRPRAVAIGDNKLYQHFKDRVDSLNLSSPPEILVGNAGIETLLTSGKSEVVIAAISGIRGLRSTVLACQNAKAVAIANKESIVCGWHILKSESQKSGCKIILVDSEHNSLYRLLNPAEKNQIESVAITASGGRYAGREFLSLVDVVPSEAIKHPNWTMGQKISIDSSTMANKGLELIEACQVFDLPESKVEVLIQKESIVHAAVKYIDGSCKQFLSMPDMRVHIAHAIIECARLAKLTDISSISNLTCQKVNFLQLQPITFAPVPKSQFPIFYIARQVARSRSIKDSIAFNALNDIAVQMFLRGQIGYCDIFYFIRDNMHLADLGQGADISTVHGIELYIDEVISKSKNSNATNRIAA